MNDPPQSAPRRLRIWQQNLNKSNKAQFDLTNSTIHKRWDIILLQEPYLDAYGNSKASRNWRVIYPTNRTNDTVARSVILINAQIDTDEYTQLTMEGSRDITAVQFKGNYGRLSIFNIYNDIQHSDTLNNLRQYINKNRAKICSSNTDSMIWAGDFNRHHPLWDELRNRQLFTKAAIKSARILINLVADFDMTMALPKGIPTLQHMVTKNWTRPDNIFTSYNLQNHIIKCETMPGQRGPGTDHVPIQTTLDITPTRKTPTDSYNIRMMDWKEVRKDLTERIQDIPEPQEITNEAQFQKAVNDLTGVLQDLIRANAPLNKPCPHSRRWWNKNLDDLRKENTRLNNLSYKFRAVADHFSHAEHTHIRTAYGDALTAAKLQHWTDFLEEATEQEMWIANKYISNPVGDGGLTRIPTLNTTNEDGQPAEATTNSEKSDLLATAFFPKRPDESAVPSSPAYPTPIKYECKITREQIRRAIAKLQPYKAFGIDEIPNILLKEVIGIIVNHLYFIFRAVFKLNTYSDRWRDWITVVLRKPGKPQYNVAKAYRPIALLNTIPKLLTTIIAEDITYMCEHHQLLPATHFGGRPGRTTTDSMHLLTSRIKDAWRNKKVASILYLDIEGAFPNAVTKQLLHNMRTRRIPEEYVLFVGRLLSNRRTKIKFDDYLSEFISIDNGIGQGDPLSMIIYLFYNADLIDIAHGEETAVAFVDDAALYVEGTDFEETHKKLEIMMTRPRGGLEWSKAHNSKFETSKLRIVDHTTKRVKHPFMRGKTLPAPRPAFHLNGTLIKRETSYKFLGVMFDQELNWKDQAAAALAKGTKWILMFRRLTKVSTGIHPKLMRQMYQAVALPKMIYAADVWYTPPHIPPGKTRRVGSVTVLREIQQIQRQGTLAITGALRSTATDILDLHANVLPIELQLKKACHRAITRIATLPDTHPLYQPVRRCAKRYVKHHRSALHHLTHLFNINPDDLETITPTRRPPHSQTPFTTEIAKTRDESKQHSAEDKADIRIFTDGSGYEGMAGAAAILYRQRRRPKILRYHLGPLTQHTTFEAEAVGAVLGAALLQKERDITTVTLYIDCQSIITSTGITKSQPGQQIVDEFHRLTNHSYDNSYRPTYQLRIVWISAHDDVEGNEAVDRAAKEAAQGATSDTNTLPLLLTDTLGFSSSAVKQEYNETLKNQWTTTWKESPRYARVSLIDPSLPSRKFMANTAELTRAQTSVLVQLRSGHIPLNLYLFRIGKADVSMCPNCRQTRETIHHYLFECRTHSRHRFALRQAIGPSNAASLQYLLGNRKAYKSLLNYVGATKRFKTTLGDVAKNL